VSEHCLVVQYSIIWFPNQVQDVLENRLDDLLHFATIVRARLPEPDDE